MTRQDKLGYDLPRVFCVHTTTLRYASPSIFEPTLTYALPENAIYAGDEGSTNATIADSIQEGE
jgi:hypothetical protein